MKNVSTKQQQIATIAKRKREEAISCINHYLDIEWLKESYRRTRKDGAVGIDGQTAKDYEKDLDRNLESLLNRAKSGRYKAPPVRRVYIPKDKPGEFRPIGIPTLEDKVLQRGVLMLTEPIFEQSFYEFSFGFRSGRSQHQAIDYLRQEIFRTRANWILEVDLSKFFDTVNHAKLRDFFKMRVSDGVINRLVGKWLKAGIMEDKVLRKMKEGTPQGGVISPLLSNIYLHVVIDHWFSKIVKPRSRGRSFIVRYADDILMGFETYNDVEKLLDALPKRLDLFDLKLNKEKTRIIKFRKPDNQNRPDRPNRPGTFNFLGFTFYWGRTRKGGWTIKPKTEKRKFSYGLKKISKWCKKNRHLKIKMQHEKITLKLKGHYSYYGITNNFQRLKNFRNEVGIIWYKWLKRRSSKSKSIKWSRMNILLSEHYPLPPARVVHSIYKAKP